MVAYVNNINITAYVNNIKIIENAVTCLQIMSVSAFKAKN